MSSASGSTTLSPTRIMYDRVLSIAIQQMLYAVARLNIADLIQAGEPSVEQLAAQTKTDARVLYRVLRALAGEGIFLETEDRHFELTPQAEVLCSDAPNSLRPLLMLIGADWHLQAWSCLDVSLRTGESAFDSAHGEALFDHLQKEPGRSAVYSGAMTGRTGAIARDVVASYDFSKFNTVMDVGGGHGVLLTTILQAHPHLKGVLYDLPGISRANTEVLDDSGVADRCTIEEGSFFEKVPTGADAIIMKSIIHDWNDEKAREILVKCREAIEPSATLLLCEFIVPGKNQPDLSKLMDLEMLVMSGGAERSEDEYRELLASAGFGLQRVVPTSTAFNVLECSVSWRARPAN
jgi:hypothetical protein